MLNTPPQIILIFLFSISLIGCGTAPSFSLNETRMQSPEVVGDSWSARVGAGRDQRSVVGITNKDDSDGDGDFLFLDAALGYQGFELFFFGSRAETLGIKYQFAGDNSKQATAGNISHAISLSVENSNSNIGYYGSQSEQDCSPDCIRWSTKIRTLDLAWIAGYRVDENFIFYGGPYIQHGYLRVTSDLVADSELDGRSARKVGLSLAGEYRFHYGLGLTLEIARSKTRWHDLLENHTGVSFKIDYLF